MEKTYEKLRSELHELCGHFSMGDIKKNECYKVLVSKHDYSLLEKEMPNGRGHQYFGIEIIIGKDYDGLNPSLVTV